jgi:hypothetical protein
MTVLPYFYNKQTLHYKLEFILLWLKWLVFKREKSILRRMVHNLHQYCFFIASNERVLTAMLGEGSQMHQGDVES